MDKIDFVKEKMVEFAREIPPATVDRTAAGFGDDPTEKLTLSLPVGEGMQIEMTFHKSFTQCSTNYKAHDKWFSFDRYGVEDSFYFDSLEDLQGLIKTFREQVERVRTAQQRLAQSQRFNFGPVTLYLTQERLTEIVENLKAGKTHQYMPSGFGTGYNFSIRNIANRYDRAKASKELEDLVGRKVYITAFDAD